MTIFVGPVGPRLRTSSRLERTRKGDNERQGGHRTATVRRRTHSAAGMNPVNGKGKAVSERDIAQSGQSARFGSEKPQVRILLSRLYGRTEA